MQSEREWAPYKGNLEGDVINPKKLQMSFMSVPLKMASGETIRRSYECLPHSNNTTRSQISIIAQTLKALDLLLKTIAE